MENTRRLIKLAGCIGLTLYVSAYIIMSSNGLYACWYWTSGGGWRYRWLPAGFSDHKTRENTPFWNYIFMPLWYIDNAIWHKPELATNGDYPREEF